MAAKSDVKLLGAWASPFVLRARVVLNVKAVDYEYVEESLWNKSELLLKSNPVYKKVPVLLHGDRPVCESLVIVQYVDEVWADGPSLLPSDPYDRAIARFWASYVDDKWFPALMGIVRAPTEEAKAASAEQVEAGLQLLEEAFEKCSKGKAFFGGDCIGYLDIAVGSFVASLRAAEKMSGFKFLDEGKVPNLAAWADTYSSQTAVKEVMPDPDKLVEFIKSLQARFRTGPPPRTN